MRWSAIVGIGLFVGAATLGITVLTASSNQSANQTEPSQLPIVVKPLLSADGVVHADLRCSAANITPPASLETFSCTLKNNADKSILAVNLEYSVILESGGRKVADTRFHTLDAYIHPDLYEANKAILPGGERVVASPGPMFYEDSAVKGIEVKINYVEFEDKTTLGDREKGAQIIADIRGGAAKYRAWLFNKYTENGRSAEALTRLLQQDLPVPSELDVKSQYEEQGARAYRTRLRRISETRGAAEIHKYLSK